MSKFLEVYGANTHNLKNIDVKIPKEKLVVITGVSGSGKSSLAFNTIYNEGQKKYLESLSSYARMFVGGMNEEAEVREIKGLSPTISIEQKTVSHNPRSTVGTITEIYDYYKLLFLHLGERKCVKCGSTVRKDTVDEIISELSTMETGEKFMVTSRILKGEEISFEIIKKFLLNKGFIRFMIDGKIYTINDDVKVDNSSDVYVVVDRLVVKDFSDEDSADAKRLKDSLNLAFEIGEGCLELFFPSNDEIKKFSNVFVCSDCGHIPEELNISSFSFNSHHGACESCHGLGEKTVFLEENLVNPNLTIEEGAVIAQGFGNYFISLMRVVAKKYDFSLNIPYKKYPKEIRKLIMLGTGDTKYKVNFTGEDGSINTYNSRFEGVINTLSRRYYEGSGDVEKISKFSTLMDCPECNGHRLKKESLSIYIDGRNIGEMASLPVSEALEFFINYSYPAYKEKIAKGILKNIVDRLTFLNGVGLPYISLSRRANTLSGGEGQRIRLATQIGTRLEGIIYVLDEPSIGLHPRDNDMLIDNLKKLRDIGNTLIVVEHDEDIMHESDHIIDIGPGAGVHGGDVVFQGSIEEIMSSKDSVTGPYLNGQKSIKVDRESRQIKNHISVIGAKENNLKNVNVDIPLGNLVTVTGVSGSGKSSLVNGIIANYLSNNLNRSRRQVGKVDKIEGLENVDKTVIIDQSPIGRTPRSNPATYTGVFTHIRDVFAQTEEAKIRGYAPGKFSFNTKGGRCENCDGDGVKKVEMHFLPPVYVTCDSCKGKRYKKEVLQISYKGKTISDVLNMTIEEAFEFFSSHPKIKKIMQVLMDVGLGYVKLGQSSLTLSGGEAQRIKLATELSKRSTGKTFYILDEPTTGLHFQDVQKLLNILHSLVNKGNSVLVIEHNMDVILNSDHIIDIGPEGGDKGGKVVATGGLKDIVKAKKSYTGKAIKKYLDNKK